MAKERFQASRRLEGTEEFRPASSRKHGNRVGRSDPWLCQSAMSSPQRQEPEQIRNLLDDNEHLTTILMGQVQVADGRRRTVGFLAGRQSPRLLGKLLLLVARSGFVQRAGSLAVLAVTFATGMRR